MLAAQSHAGELNALLGKLDGSAIVYVMTQKEADVLADQVQPLEQLETIPGVAR